MHFSHLREGGRVAVFHHPDLSARAVSVTGSFTGWSTPGVPMRREENGFWADVDLPAGDGDVTYKLIVDGRWTTDARSRTSAPDGTGGENSVLPRDGRGTTLAFSFHSPALGRARSYLLHLPAGHATGRRFPLLVLLHGALDDERAWLQRGGLAGAADDLTRRGEIGELIVAMPFEPGDLFRGDPRVADYLARDVVGHLDFELPTLASPAHRAVDGLSTGGFTSLALGAQRPDVFRSIGSMSGSFDHRLARAVEEAAAGMRAAGQRHLLSCGLDEPHLGSCRAMFDHLRGLGLEPTWREAPGIHDWPVWRALLADHLRFHWSVVQPR